MSLSKIKRLGKKEKTRGKWNEGVRETETRKVMTGRDGRGEKNSTHRPRSQSHSPGTPRKGQGPKSAEPLGTDSQDDRRESLQKAHVLPQKCGFSEACTKYVKEKKSPEKELKLRGRHDDGGGGAETALGRRPLLCPKQAGSCPRRSLCQGFPASRNFQSECTT